MTNKEYLDTLRVCGYLEDRDFARISKKDLEALYNSKINIKDYCSELLDGDVIEDVNSVLYFFVKLLNRIKDEETYKYLINKVNGLNNKKYWDKYDICPDMPLINFIFDIDKFIKTKELDLRLLKILNIEGDVSFSCYNKQLNCVENFECDTLQYMIDDLNIKNKVSYFDLFNADTDEIYLEGVALIVLKNGTMYLYTLDEIKSLRTMKKVLRKELNKEFDALIMYRNDDIDKMIIDILNEKH